MINVLRDGNNISFTALWGFSLLPIPHFLTWLSSWMSWNWKINVPGLYWHRALYKSSLKLNVKAQRKKRCQNNFIFFWFFEVERCLNMDENCWYPVLPRHFNTFSSAPKLLLSSSSKKPLSRQSDYLASTVGNASGGDFCWHVCWKQHRCFTHLQSFLCNFHAPPRMIFTFHF